MEAGGHFQMTPRDYDPRDPTFQGLSHPKEFTSYSKNPYYLKDQTKYNLFMKSINFSPIFDINAKDAHDFPPDLLNYGKKNNLEKISFNDVGYVNPDQHYYMNQVPQGTVSLKICGKLN
jgi:hypothetical protein